MALSVLVIGGSAALYAFSMRRAAQDAGKAQVMAQAQAVLEDISRTIRQSCGCDLLNLTNSGVFNQAKALRCALPQTMVDTDGQAGPDSFLADQVNEGGAEIYLPGSYVFYVWLKDGWQNDPQKRLVRISQASPDPALFTENLQTWDPLFTFSSVSEEKFRFDRVTALDFKVDSQNRSATVTLSGSASGFSASGTAAAGEENNSRSVSLSRSVGWLNEMDGREQGRGPNFLVNGDFAKNNLTGWTAQGTSASGLTTSYSVTESSYYAMQMNWGNQPGSLVLSQDVSLAAGEDYILSFSLGFFAGTLSKERACTLKVVVLDTESGEPLVERVLNDWSAEPAGPSFWTEYSIPFRTMNNGHRIIFTDLTDAWSSVSRDPFLAKIAVRRLN